MEIRFEKNKAVFYFRYNEEIIDYIKKIPNRQYNEINKNWYVNINHTSLEYIKKFAVYLGFKVDDKIQNLIIESEKIKKENFELSNTKESNYQLKNKLNFDLLPFQKAGVHYCITNLTRKVSNVFKTNGTYIADDMGIGKTIQSLVVINELDSYPCLIVTPNSMKYSWEFEINKFFNSKDVSILPNKEHLFGKDFTIINYDNIEKYEKKLINNKFQSIIFDEAHVLKKETTRRTRSAFNISKKAKHTLELSGTPIVNRPSELISQLDILSMVEQFGGKWNFKNRYCDPQENDFGISYNGASNTKELHDKLRMFGYLRRNKEDVLKDLPSKVRKVIPFELSNKREYNKAQNKITSYLKKELDNQYKDVSLAEKRKINAQFYMRMLNAKGVIKLETLKQLAVKGILNSAIEWIDEFIQNEKLIVFCHHTEIVYKLQERFNCPIIKGGVSAKDRQKIVEDFQNNKNTKLLVGNIKAMSVGLTLTASNSVAFLEYPDTPGELDQAEDRVYRIGQTRNVFIYYLIGKKSIYDHLIRLIEQKRLVTNQVNAGIDEKTTTEISILNELLKIYK